jgi:hypothetical protein
MKIKQIIIKVYAEEVSTTDVERETERDEKKKRKKDDISDAHKSTDQSRPTIVVGIKSSFC